MSEQMPKAISVSYRREMNHNYMIINSLESEAEGYECKMLASNGIEGLLKFRLRLHDDKKEFYYEITSKQPLSRLLERKMINGNEIRQLILGIATTLNRAEEFLLKEERILMEPEYIYIEPDNFLVYLCVVPGYSCDFPSAFTLLLQYLLEKVNHRDKDGVVLAYNLYHASLKENYGMSDLLDYLTEEKEEPVEKAQSKSVFLQNPNDTDMREWRGNQEIIKDQEIRSSIKLTENDEAKKEEKLYKKKNCFFIKPVKSLLLIIAAEGLLWCLMGITGLYRYGLWVGIGIIGMILLKYILPYKRNPEETSQKNPSEYPTKYSTENRTKDLPENQSWKMVFEEESDLEKDKDEEVEKAEDSETVLLVDLDQKSHLVTLESLDRKRESIEIAYVPYVIGNHTEITDYCLSRPTVSRLHLRIDQKEGVYIVTDLNSTNGTIVEGYHLQANETVSIKNGDILYLADAGYRFLEQHAEW